MLTHVDHDRTRQSRFNGKMSLNSTLLAVLSFAPFSVFAHHPLAGRTPETVFEGLASGIGHPVIGIDHLAFVIAVGLMAAATRRGLLIPLGFVLGGLVGVAFHLQLFTLPAAELLIAVSIIVFGFLLARNKPVGLQAGVGLGAIAGIFHGYAYAEAIVGASMPTLVSYLAGLTLIQLAIAWIFFFVAKTILDRRRKFSYRPLRVAGVAVAGIGTAFLTFAALG